MNNNNLTIIKSILIFIIYSYSNFTKTVISIILYMVIKFIVYITTESVKQIQCENTLFSDSTIYVFHFTDVFCMSLRYIIRYSYPVFVFLSRIFVGYLEPSPVLFSCLITISKFLKLIGSIFSASFTIMEILKTLDLINLIPQYLEKDEFKHMHELVKTINNSIHM